MSARPPLVVAIDGPSGSGKSTVARAVADALGLEPLDTGAMYRAVTVALLERGTDPSDAACATHTAEELDLVMGARVEVGGRDVTEEIRGPEVTAAVSTVAAHPGVRAALVARQRAWVEARGGGVVEGRDIGTVVFPDATCKVYLTASEDERAERRREQDAAASQDTGAVRDALRRRDERDSRRSASPLRAAPDAVVIDTTMRAADEVVAEVLGLVRSA